VNSPFARVSLDELNRQGVLTGLSAAAAKALDDTGLVEVRPAALASGDCCPAGTLAPSGSMTFRCK